MWITCPARTWDTIDTAMSRRIKFGDELMIRGHLALSKMSSETLEKSESHSVVSHSLWLHGLYSPWNSPGQNIGVGSHSLLQGIFPTQESNPGFPHCRQILYQLSHKGSPRILEWVAYPFSRGSSQPKNWTGISCIAGRLFYQLSSQGRHLVHAKRSCYKCPHLESILGFK